MHSERVRYVLVPGWYGSEDAHWQSHWQRALPNASRVEQQDWITRCAPTGSPSWTPRSAASPGRWC